MTSCIPTRRLTINGSLNNLSDLALLKQNARFVHADHSGTYLYPQTVKTLSQTDEIFKVSGDIELKRNGRINWAKSNVSNIRFKDPSNRLNNFQINDHWQLDFDLKSLIKSKSKNYLKLLFRNSFELVGDRENNVIDFTSIPFARHYDRLPISGGAGADVIIGTKRNDLIAASSSRDICDFGTGTNLSINVKDILTGDTGIDTFYADNGTQITDIEKNETIHIFNHNSFDLDNIPDKSPSFKHKPNKTIIEIGDLKIITNPAKFDFYYKFYTPNMSLCTTDRSGTSCDRAWIPGEPEGYSFIATEVL